MSKRPYWLRDDYEDQIPKEFLVYPKRLTEVIGELALRGLRCSRKLMRSNPDEVVDFMTDGIWEFWNREEIDSLAELVNNHKRLT